MIYYVNNNYYVCICEIKLERELIEESQLSFNKLVAEQWNAVLMFK